jgi:fatty acid/phospholipid biosynthesis enzyme
LQWLKEIVEPYLSFEHETLKRKHWIIVCLGELDPKVANEIESLQKLNSLYRFIVVSTWPISSKLIDVTAIPYEGVPEISIATEEVSKEPEEKEVEDKKKVGKDKKEKKYKVKQVKEGKADAEVSAGNNSSQPSQEL